MEPKDDKISNILPKKLVDIPTAYYSEYFHGELWVECPNCKSGNQLVGAKPEFKVDGYAVYKCEKCGELFKERL